MTRQPAAHLERRTSTQQPDGIGLLACAVPVFSGLHHRRRAGWAMRDWIPWPLFAELGAGLCPGVGGPDRSHVDCAAGRPCHRAGRPAPIVVAVRGCWRGPAEGGRVRYHLNGWRGEDLWRV